LDIVVKADYKKTSQLFAFLLERIVNLKAIEGGNNLSVAGYLAAMI
jgi:hypothetical protein